MTVRNISHKSDGELISTIKSDSPDSESAFAEIYERYASRLYAYCRRAVNSRELSEDIFQETFYRFYQKIKSDFENISVMGFLITVARNMCLNHQRNKMHILSIDEINTSDEYNSLTYNENTDEFEELSEMAVMALDYLEPEYKEVIILRYYANLSYNEIADIFVTTANSIRVKVHRAKSKIKTILTDYDKNLLK